ncbi:MAG: DUF3617 domain-containing protein [Pseudomonadota bacterium]|nr:DUF3617 domain-containing protein [Pseudomonadota bacterium]
MKHALIVSLGAFALTACGGGATDADADGDGSVTAEEAREAIEASGDELKPLPGKYKSTMTFVDAEIPGAPEEMKAMMGNAMNVTSEFCLTEEDAAGGFKESIEKGRSDACEINSFNIDGSKVDMKMSCNENGTGDMLIAMNGNVTPTKQDMDMKMDGEMPGLGAVKIEMSFVQERIGECDA